jgi:polysaccharide export outer membrane protein
LYNIGELPITNRTTPSTRLLVLLGSLALWCAIASGQTAPPANATPPPAPANADSPKPAAGAPQAAQAAQPVDPKTYVIGIQDELKIEVFRETELTRNVTVRTDGKITMPLLNDIQAEGLTPERLQQHITEGLTGPLVNPTVTVSVITVNSKKYNIGGMVNHPGTYFLVTPIKIFDALNSAGGFRDFANTKDITIVRGTKRIKFNYNDFLKGKNTDQNIDLENGDTIYVK